MAIITCEKCGKKYSDQSPDGCPECSKQDTQKINQQNGHRAINKQLTIYLVVAFFVGFFAGREHIKYEIRKNIATAAQSISDAFNIPASKPSKTVSATAEDGDIEEKREYMHYVEISDFKLSEGEKFGERVPAIFGTIKNNGNRSLRKVRITVYYLDENETVIGEEDFHPVLVSEYNYGSDNKPLKPNYVRDFGYSVADAPSTWAERVSVAVTNIEFED